MKFYQVGLVSAFAQAWLPLFAQAFRFSHPTHTHAHLAHPYPPSASYGSGKGSGRSKGNPDNFRFEPHGVGNDMFNVISDFFSSNPRPASKMSAVSGPTLVACG